MMACVVCSLTYPAWGFPLTREETSLEKLPLPARLLKHALIGVRAKAKKMK